MARLAFLYSAMVSPNVAEGADGPALTREGRLYFDPDGKLIRVLKRIVENGKEVAPIDNDKYQLARGCGLTAPHATLDDVAPTLISELGDIEGTRGEFIVEPLDWCGLGVRASLNGSSNHGVIPWRMAAKMGMPS